MGIQSFSLFAAMCACLFLCTTASQGARNIQGSSLQLCSTSPMTGWLRDGYCNTDNRDHGTHVVCAIMTEEFLTYTKAQGNDLSTPTSWFPGLRPGDGWCLCALRWRQAYRAGKAPSVKVQATHSKALEFISRTTLENFAVQNYQMSSSSSRLSNGW